MFVAVNPRFRRGQIILGGFFGGINFLAILVLLGRFTKIGQIFEQLVNVVRHARPVFRRAVQHVFFGVNDGGVSPIRHGIAKRQYLVGGSLGDLGGGGLVIALLVVDELIVILHHGGIGLLHHALGGDGGLLDRHPLAGGGEIILRGLAGVRDLLLLAGVGMELFQLVVAGQQGGDVFRDDVKILLLLVKHVGLLVHPGLKRQGADAVDDGQGILGFVVFRVLGGQVSVGLVAHDIALCGEFGRVRLIGQYGGDALLVEVGPLLADLAHFLGLVGQRRVVELGGHLVHLAQVVHQFAHLLLGFLVGFILGREHIIALLHDAFERGTFHSGAVLHRRQRVLGQ